MRGLDAFDVLSCFEEGAGRTPLEKGLLLLRFAWPEAGEDLYRRLPLAERDRLLLALRRATLGNLAPVVASCPHCGAELETGVDLDHLLAAAAPEDPFGDFPLTLGGRELRLRLPSTEDFAEALRQTPAEARRHLARRTLISPDPPPLDEEHLDAIATAWDAADPLSEIRLDLECAECGRAFDEIFDIVSFFAAEVDHQARRLLLEIHALASAYGWTESEVLALGPQRRRLYVEMVS